MSLSIVIPVYEDREACAALVPTILEYGEVVVVDASVRDPIQAGELPAEVVLVRSERAQRAYQMNLGVTRTTGSELLFLHADTLVSPEGFSALARVWSDPGVVGGGFARRFASDSLVLRLTCWMADWRGRWWGWFLGDQALFVRREVFEAIGGYRSLKVFEDYDLCRRMAERGEMRCLSPVVVSSARRFQNGVLRRVAADLWLTLVFLIRGESAFLEE